MSMLSDDQMKYTLYSADQVSIIPIPPPNPVTHRHELSKWNLSNIVWTGSLEVIESELLDAGLEYSENSLKLNIILMNGDGTEWASIQYTDDHVRITESISIYSVIATLGEKKIALGLKLKNKNQAYGFSEAIQDFKRRRDARLESNNEEDGGYISQRMYNEEVGVHTIEKVRGRDSESDSESDDFGDFISSDDLR